MHPEASGEAIGKGSLADFFTFASAVATLSGGVYLNIGSAVILPEVFLKAISLARNLGAQIENFMTVNMDFIRHYRPQTNVVSRPTAGSGRGITLVGHHEIMVPLLCAGIIDALEVKVRKRRQSGWALSFRPAVPDGRRRSRVSAGVGSNRALRDERSAGFS